MQTSDKVPVCVNVLTLQVERRMVYICQGCGMLLLIHPRIKSYTSMIASHKKSFFSKLEWKSIIYMYRYMHFIESILLTLYIIGNQICEWDENQQGMQATSLHACI